MDAPQDRRWPASGRHRAGHDRAAAAFFESREYTSTPRTLAEHVTRLYRAFLSREPEPGAVTPWVDFLVVQRAGLADAFIQSPEFAFRLRTLFP